MSCLEEERKILGLFILEYQLLAIFVPQRTRLRKIFHVESIILGFLKYFMFIHEVSYTCLEEEGKILDLFIGVSITGYCYTT